MVRPRVGLSFTHHVDSRYKGMVVYIDVDS